MFESVEFSWREQFNRPDSCDLDMFILGHEQVVVKVVERPNLVAVVLRERDQIVDP